MDWIAQQAQSVSPFASYDALNTAFQQAPH